MIEPIKTDFDELSERIIYGVRKAVRKLVEANAAKNEDMVIGDKNGKAKIVPAKELLRRLQGHA